jgi:hypothetical protein
VPADERHRVGRLLPGAPPPLCRVTVGVGSRVGRARADPACLLPDASYLMPPRAEQMDNAHHIRDNLRWTGALRDVMGDRVTASTIVAGGSLAWWRETRYPAKPKECTRLTNRDSFGFHADRSAHAGAARESPMCPHRPPRPRNPARHAKDAPQRHASANALLTRARAPQRRSRRPTRSPRRRRRSTATSSRFATHS